MSEEISQSEDRITGADVDGVRPQVAVVQGHARLHYAVPIALKRQGMLGRMFVDWYGGPESFAGRVSGLLGKMSAGLGKRMGGRYAKELEGSDIQRNLWLRVRYEMLPGTLSGFDPSVPKWSQEAAGGWIGRRGFGECDALHGFIRNIWPALYEQARGEGMKTTGEQIIAPAVVEQREAEIQSERFKGWGDTKFNYDLGRVGAIEHETWGRLDRVSCPSAFVRQGLIEQGIGEEQITVAPYPVDATRYAVPDRAGRTGPVTVGFVGKVSLRKGVPYFFEVAKRFSAKDVRFVMVGPVGIDAQIAKDNQGDVELMGSVPRTQVAEQLEKFDMILFPSTCEGSAGALMEAMAMGLPIVTSLNSGTVVRDGHDGFICDYDDIDAMVERIERLAGDAELRLKMGRDARASVEQYNLDWYGEALGWMFRGLMQQGGGDE